MLNYLKRIITGLMNMVKEINSIFSSTREEMKRKKTESDLELDNIQKASQEFSDTVKAKSEELESEFDEESQKIEQEKENLNQILNSLEDEKSDA